MYYRHLQQRNLEQQLQAGASWRFRTFALTGYLCGNLPEWAKIAEDMQEATAETLAEVSYFSM